MENVEDQGRWPGRIYNPIVTLTGFTEEVGENPCRGAVVSFPWQIAEGPDAVAI